MKLFIISLCLTCAVSLSAQVRTDTVGQKATVPKETQVVPDSNRNRYQQRADSLRKENLQRGRTDTVIRSRHDNMPELRKDSNGDRMPSKQPQYNDQMPVKELSDTSNKRK
jgi:hypothetical protein